MTVKTEIGNITATKDVLNEISLAFGRSEEVHKRRGHLALADRDDNISFAIYRALAETGYYNER